MKKGARQSTNVIDLRGAHKNAIDEVQDQRLEVDKTRLFNKTPLAQQKSDPIEDLVNSFTFAGNKDPRGRISDLGVSPQRGFSGTNKPQRLKKPKGK